MRQDPFSVVLTTLNEERNIDRCLASVAWADDIVVVDSFSRDATVERARRYTQRVYQHEYPGSSRQVERGIGYATGEWVFVIDADEEVTPELAAEIRRILEAAAGVGAAVGYDVPRKVNAFGKWLVAGGWYPDYQFRFFRKDSYRAEHQEVHGGFVPTGLRGRLSSFLLHYTYETIHDYMAKINDYTSLHVANILKERPRRRGAMAQADPEPALAFPQDVRVEEGVQGRLPRIRPRAARCRRTRCSCTRSSGSTGCGRSPAANSCRRSRMRI